MSMPVHLLYSGNLGQAHSDCWILDPAEYIQIEFSYPCVLSDYQSSGDDWRPGQFVLREFAV